MNGRKRAHWGLTVGSVSLVALAIFGSLVSTSGLIENIRADLGLTYARGGFLLSAPFPVIVCFALMGGVLVDRLGARRMVALGGAIALVAGGSRAWAESYWLLTAGTVLIGAGVGLIYPALPKIVSAEAPAGKKEAGATIYTLGVMIGSSLGIGASHLMIPLMPLIPLAPGTGGWRGGFFGWTLILLAAFSLWFWVSSGGEEAEETEAGGREAAGAGAGGGAGVLRRPGVWAVGGSLTVTNAIFYTCLGWLPALLSEKGWTPAAAITATSIVAWTGLPAAMSAYWLAPRVGGERRMLLACILATTLTLAILPSAGAWPAIAWTVLFGFALNYWFVFCLGYPARSVPTDQAGRAAGVIFGLGYLGGFAGPWAAGAVRDAGGGFAPAFFGLAAAAALSALSSPFFGRPVSR